MATREQRFLKKFIAGLASMEQRIDELDRSVDRVERDWMRKSSLTRFWPDEKSGSRA